MIKICSIASGSNGNCYYIGNETEAILVDVGISRKQVLERMKSINLDASKVKAIFISHEHADHYRGVRVLSNKLSVPVYLTQKTFEKGWKNSRPTSYRFFKPGDVIEVGSFKIHSFLKNHDAAEPCSFRIEYNNINIGVFTDIGEPCDNLLEHFSKCNAMFLESNYDDEMLINGSYPQHLKVRIASNKGHLSNNQASKLLNDNLSKQLELVILSHLSGDTNTPELAFKAFEKFQDNLKIEVASRHNVGSIYEIE